MSELCAYVVEFEWDSFHMFGVTPGQHAMVVVEDNWWHGVDPFVCVMPAGGVLWLWTAASRGRLCEYDDCGCTHQRFPVQQTGSHILPRVVGERFACRRFR